MDLTIKRGTGDHDVSMQDIHALRDWARDRGDSPMRRAIMLLVADLTEGKPVHLVVENDRGFSNHETMATATLLDNSRTYYDNARHLARLSQAQESPLGWLAGELQGWVEARLYSFHSREIGSLWRVNWREIAEHVMKG